MITKELIERINYLARKKKEAGLTADEEIEQAEVRRQYIEGIKDQIRPTLEASREAAKAAAEAGTPPEFPHIGGCDCPSCKH